MDFVAQPRHWKVATNYPSFLKNVVQVIHLWRNKIINIIKICIEERYDWRKFKTTTTLYCPHTSIQFLSTDLGIFQLTAYSHFAVHKMKHNWYLPYYKVVTVNLYMLFNTHSYNKETRGHPISLYVPPRLIQRLH